MRGGNPAASSWASKISCRTPWMDTRPKVSVTVVKAPTTSNPTARLTSWSAKALSLPLDHEISAFGCIELNDRRSSPSRAAAALLRRTRRCRRRFAERADLSQRRLRRALAAFPGAVDRAPQGLVGRFAREKHVADRLGEDFSRWLRARWSNGHRAERVGCRIPARRT